MQKNFTHVKDQQQTNDLNKRRGLHRFFDTKAGNIIITAINAIVVCVIFALLIMLIPSKYKFFEIFMGLIKFLGLPCFISYALEIIFDKNHLASYALATIYIGPLLAFYFYGEKNIIFNSIVGIVIVATACYFIDKQLDNR